MDSRLIGTWRIEAVAGRTGDCEDPNPTWIIHPPDPEKDPRLGEVEHMFRGDGTGQISNRAVGALPADQFTWRLDDEAGQLYLTLDTPVGPVSMRVWLRSDGRLVWEQNVFSRRTAGRREWFNPTSGQWVGREWVAQFSGCAAFVLVRDGAPAAAGGPGSAEAAVPAARFCD
jgi:hypothetical protein